jgi:hypothetical protein
MVYCSLCLTFYLCHKEPLWPRSYHNYRYFTRRSSTPPMQLHKVTIVEITQVKLEKTNYTNSHINECKTTWSNIIDVPAARTNVNINYISMRHQSHSYRGWVVVIRMVVRLTATCTIGAYHYYCCEFEYRTALCYKVCQ